MSFLFFLNYTICFLYFTFGNQALILEQEFSENGILISIIYFTEVLKLFCHCHLLYHETRKQTNKQTKNPLSK